MRLFALTFGDASSASTSYRILQYAPHFQEAGIEFSHAPAVKFSDFSRLRGYDVVLLQKTLLSCGKLHKIRRYSKRFIYDADDRIWFSPNKTHSWWTQMRINRRLKTIARLADHCMAANSVIATDLRDRGADVSIVPMSLDGRIWKPVPHPGQVLTIGWSGSPKNLAFLESILPQLREVQRRHRQVCWAVHCGRDPGFSDFTYRHIPYQPGKEGEAVAAFDVGLLPLPDNPFARGKSPIKALQYLACGVPVVAAPVGATCDILQEGKNSLYCRADNDWSEKPALLIEDPEMLGTLAVGARAAFEMSHQTDVVFKKMMECINA